VFLWSSWLIPFVIPSEVEESLNSMSEERKTLEQREHMTDIECLRHSASHVLAFCHSEAQKPSESRMERWGNRDMDGRADTPSERARASQISH